MIPLLNSFYTRFERPDLALDTAELNLCLMPPSTLILQKENVPSLPKATLANKAAGPDGICGRTLKYCAEQLSSVLLKLHQSSLDQGVVPLLWKTSAIIPIPKKGQSLLSQRPQTHCPHIPNHEGPREASRVPHHVLHW